LSQVVKFNNYSRRHVYYIAPCGRRLRNMDEIHKYLRVTQSALEIDFFNLEW
jgi:histone-lysine N-methyltransferase SETDB1